MKRFIRAIGRRGIRWLGYREHRTGHSLVLVPRTDTLQEHAYEMAAYVLEVRLQELLQSLAISVVIDVGANTGQFATKLRVFGFTGRIISFEPNPALLAPLQALAASDGQWTVVSAALGAAAGEAELHVTSSSDYASLHAPKPDTARDRTDAMAVTARTTVPIETLDGWLAQHPGMLLPTDRLMIKTDTQGHDLEVLSGAAMTLPLASLLLAELAQLPLYHGVPLFSEGVAWFRSQGFALAAVAPVGGIDAESGAIVEFDGLFVALPAARR